MVTTRIPLRFAVLGIVLAAACNDEVAAPTAPGQDGSAMQMDHGMGAMTSNITAADAPFTFRAPLEPYKIQQLPDFQIHSKATSDIVIQRSVFQPGAGPWHTHPGPSFVYVIEGEIKVERVTKAGCTETPVHGPGKAYFEVADEVHRAVVVSAGPAVLLVTRFNIPPGEPITKMAADPGC